MKSNSFNQYELSILVDGKPITEYSHDGSVFVEGRSGSEYTIRARNTSSDRVCVIISVDGLSILDGQECSDNSPGYLLSPWQTLDIACYKVDESTGAKFVFGAKEKSYSAEIGKGTTNVGVIAAAVFREKHQPRPVHYSGCFGGSPSLKKSMGPTRSWHESGSLNNSSWSLSSNIGSGSLSNAGSGSLGQSISNIQCSASATNTAAAAEPVEQNLGTVFGESMSWKTQTVEFKREAMAATHLVIYYDNRKNLERRGIKLEHKVPPLPNPFPGNEMGCATPKNWRK